MVILLLTFLSWSYVTVHMIVLACCIFAVNHYRIPLIKGVYMDIFIYVNTCI